MELNCAREHQKPGGVNVLGAGFCRNMKANLEFEKFAQVRTEIRSFWDIVDWASGKVDGRGGGATVA